ncbi:Helix-turn-helix domain protein [Posidoniimonas polymericola]|uniref:Helix-turn-helix domain protein n=2 Tax=Posidoniimonas polymericola TaxID=2528002 RepID=A0A5C5XTZ7_9BACT|nr:Helix-turn-helix domain protein [Posidoniimonas polymericola]
MDEEARGWCPLLMDARTAAKALAISSRKLWAMTASGEIPHVRIGRSVRYPVFELQSWVNEHTEGNR